MIDKMTNKQLQIVVQPGVAWLDLSVEQAKEVRRLFEAGKIHFWVTDHSVSYRGGPYMTNLFLEQRQDPAVAQAILDSVT